VRGSESRIHVSPGPTHTATGIGDDETRWCFGCRRRTVYRWHLLEGPFDADGMTWYDPQWVQRCDGCREDHSLFPGRWYADE